MLTVNRVGGVHTVNRDSKVRTVGSVGRVPTLSRVVGWLKSVCSAE